MAIGAVPALAASPQALPHAPKPSPKAAWTKLCNGHNLDGWEVVNTGGHWSVEDGAIVARRTPPDRGASWLVTKKDYGDFILRLKYKSAYEIYNNGILIRDPAHAKLGRPAYSGFEIIIEQGQKDENRTGAMYYVANAYPQPLHAGEWGQFEVRAIGDHIITFLNGKKMAETHSRRSYKGGIGLHLHGGAEPAENWFQDIEIQESPQGLRPFQLAEERMEQEQGAFQALLPDGSVESDFTRYGDANTAWSLESGVLQGTGAAEGGWLVSKRAYGDFILTFDSKGQAAAGGAVGVRLPADATTNFADRGYVLWLVNGDELNPPGSIYNLARGFVLDPALQKLYREGEWNRIRIYATGDHLIAYINLMKTADIVIHRASRGRLGFYAAPGATAEYRNIDVKPVGGVVRSLATDAKQADGDHARN